MESVSVRTAVEHNRILAEKLHQIADLLEAQGANSHRANAWRKAGDVVAQLGQSIAAIYESEGRDGIDRLPYIGETISHAIEFYLKAGFIPILKRLQGELRPAKVFETVPDIGPGLAKRIHEHLHIESLHALLRASNDGRLAKVPGMGPKRLLAVRESLTARLRRESKQLETKSDAVPSITDLLQVDADYRRLVAEDRIQRISPRRFNPNNEAWLPIWHTQQGGHNFTVMYSNTARAHELGMTRDWVIVVLDDEDRRDQWTVITSTFGRHIGKRIVRGLENSQAHDL